MPLFLPELEFSSSPFTHSESMSEPSNQRTVTNDENAADKVVTKTTSYTALPEVTGKGGFPTMGNGSVVNFLSDCVMFEE